MSYFNTKFAEPCEITVLKTLNGSNATKSFSVKDGKLEKVSYQMEKHFKSESFSIENINVLFDMLSQLQNTPQQFIVRGVSEEVQKSLTSRNNGTFPECKGGTPWVMIDIDNQPLPESVDPLSKKALDYIIKKLPTEFHDVSYIYQFSSSAGICDVDGTPLKKGLNVHLFFWFNQRIPGKELAAYLLLHCLKTGFYQEVFNKNGYPRIVPGVDMAPIRTPSQPHYTANPIIGKDVKCLLEDDQRLGIIKKSSEVVCLPEMPQDIVQRANTLNNQYTCELKKRHGFVKAKSLSRSKHGSGIVEYYRNPNATVTTRRKLDKYELTGENSEFVRFFFYGESTPGSWYGCQRAPLTARRHGDGEQIPLKELSDEAYELVWKKLGWFRPITTKSMALTSEGFMPDISALVDHDHNLILAPTGSGKTYATVEWIKACNDIVVYVGPTIALNDQMMTDLRSAGLNVWHYRDAPYQLTQLRYDVAVTTANSLYKVIDHLQREGKDFIIVFDEIHQSLDVFSKSSTFISRFEESLKRTKKALFLTGTITDLQIAWLMNCIDNQTNIHRDNGFQLIEFASQNEYPLIIKRDKHFDMELFLLLKDYQNLKSEGLPIPKTVIITSTSDMLKYHTMVEELDLSDESYIVSRPDNYAEEILTARNNDKPILISSPLFSLGINFEHQPATLWVATGRLDLSTNEIIQAINRGNRGEQKCSVTLFTGQIMVCDIQLPHNHIVQQKFSEFFEQEATLPGALEQHLTLERTTYLALRGLEKKTSYAVGSLVKNGAFQNYKVDEIDFDEPEVSDELQSEYEFLNERAKVKKVTRFEQACQRNRICDSSVAFARHSELRTESMDFTNPNGRLPREMTLDKHAINANWCNLSEQSHIHDFDHRKLLRMYGELIPYLTEQYHDSELTNKVLAEKVSHIHFLVEHLKKFSCPNFEVSNFCFTLRKSQRLRAGVLALVSNSKEFLSLSERFKKLKELTESVRKSNTESNRKKADEYCLEIVKSFFQSIGLRFAELRNGKGNQKYNYDKVIVPPLWDFDEMLCHLLQLEKALLKTSIAVRPEVEPKCFSQAPEDERIIDRSLCEDCLFFKRNVCMAGNHVDWIGGNYHPKHYAQECAQKVELSKKLHSKLIPIRTNL